MIPPGCLCHNYSDVDFSVLLHSMKNMFSQDEKTPDCMQQNYPEEDVPDVLESDSIAREQYRKNKKLRERQKAVPDSRKPEASER